MDYLLTYKNKSRIQDVIVGGEILLDELQESKVNAAGHVLTDSINRVKKRPKAVAFPALKSMYGHYVNNFYNSPYKLEGVTKRKVLNYRRTKNS